jgi:hypothetical protein
MSGTSVKIYVNGIEIGDLTSSVSTGVASSQSIAIGRSGLYAQDYFNGSIDQVRFFNSALTSAQVTALYEETAP